MVALFERLDRVFARDGAWAMAATATLALQFTLVFRHRPWLDEWQALQIAVQSPTLTELLHNLRYEGHPPLWYLVLRSLAALLGNPFLALPAAAAVFAGMTQGAILFASPFRRLDRLMLATSELVLFEFLTISRSMTMGCAFAILAISLWRRGQWSWLFIALLPLCDFLFGVISIALVYLRWREGRLAYVPAAIWGISGMVSAWTVRPMPDIVPALGSKGVLLGTAIWASNLSSLGLPWQGIAFKPEWNSPPPLLLGGLALGAFMAVCWRETRGRRDDALLIGGMMALTWAFSIAVYPLAIRHLMLIALLLIMLTWRHAAAGKGMPSIGFRSWLLLLSACGLATSTIAFAMPFHNAEAAAREIDRLGLRDKDWMTFPQSSAQGVSALTGILFERTSDSCVQDFVRWNHRTSKRTEQPDGLYRDLARKMKSDGRFYLLTDRYLPHRPSFVEQIAEIPAGYDGESFGLYVVGKALPASRAHHPRCNGPANPLPPALPRS
ncbi:hypothetical protein [Novosphingobium sp. EMRT-2]|uniref:hypothetical protein n=1 Tax=Novosphingobium sp. EMRT-2 TaxID=2571749 RepID=UPI0010BDAB20|nr:hypothetical protein [Novosphingobium sp. EMRT-2]QCI92532.1 hypothetical protein FA702_02510 [Novosphingobium sp. EMRT-2]